jgi:hypothetical protein
MKTLLFLLLAFSLVISLSTGCAPAPSVAPTPISSPTTVPPSATANPNLLPIRGLDVQFDRAGSRDGYWSGQMIQMFDTVDDATGRLVRDDVSQQLNEMVKLGVNTIRLELRSSSPDSAGSYFAPPRCPLPPVLGLQYPQPTQLELKNLPEFFDLVYSKGVKIQLELINTHMEEQPPTNNTVWIGSILKAVGNHPALDVVMFDGAPFMIDSNGDGNPDKCGGPAEAPLWDGPGSVPANYVQWAIGYGHSLGVPYERMSVEAIVGDYYSFKQGPGGPEMTDSHQWDPVFTVKSIFDSLGVPLEQRTYALSWYEHPKCMTAREMPCEEIGPHAWAIETGQHIRDVVGNDARIIAPEMGLYANVTEWNWTTEQALASLVWVMKSYRMDGGSFWRWIDNDTGEESEPRLAMPIKKRGVGFAYNPVAETLKQLYTVGSVPKSAFDPAAEATAVFAAATANAATAEALDSLPVDDSFDLPALDDHKWMSFANPGALQAIRDGRLVFATDGTQASTGASIVARWLLTGDFDLQLDWSLADDWTPPAADHDDAAYFSVGMGRPQRFWITRIAQPGGDVGQFMAFGEAAGQIGQPVQTSARAGKFRLTRTADTLAFFYDVGSGWQQLESITVPTGRAQIRIGISSVNSSHAFTTSFDNFKLNAGEVKYGP